MRFELFIAHRHLTRRRKTGFISLISFISVAGVTVGVAALIIVLSVMSGFDRELKRKIVSVQPHLRIEKVNGVDDAERDIAAIKNQNIPNLVSVSGYIEGQAILRSDKNAQGVIVRGVDVVNEDLSFFEKNLVSGTISFQESVSSETKRTWWFKKKKTVARTPSIVIGDGLARRLQVQIGDIVYVITPSMEKKNPFLPLPMHVKTWPVLVRGIYNVGMNDFDTQLALIDIREAQKLYRMEGKVTGISARFSNVDDAEKWKWILAGEFSNQYVFASWQDMNQNFFQALKVEKALQTILLSLIIMVAAFNIVSTLIMVVMEKTKDIGILRALGATRASIRRIFLIEGVGYGFWGIAFGVGLGLWASYKINDLADFLEKTFGFDVFPKDIYLFDRIPAEVHYSDVWMVAAFAFSTAVLAAFYPAHRAASMKPVEALRYE
ncbi:MAG: Lipoprotein-releasing system transmembrane protein LolE [Candidatus Omnitrophica bacterium ADurb.Bin277]|nr:MAG: Lipoprotein-releasing system transmembrane protein LolE [Candidatus Omnitrophica bacterium ADurb.Bin277]